MLHFDDPTGHCPYRNGVEPIGSCVEVAPRDPRPGGEGDRAALSPGNGLEGMAECGPAAALYLHKSDQSILLHYEVDLLAEKANVAVKDSPAPLLQEGFSQRFETASATYGVQARKPRLRARGETAIA